MKQDIKFTIIIPTRERADVLGPALQTIIMQDYDNLRILVSDNFSNDSTRDVVDSLTDPRITYLNTGKRLSMSHNWEFALSHVSDGWVAIVGDDDGLLPGAITRASQIAQECDVMAIGSRNAAYNWPSKPDQPFGRLSVSLKNNVDIVDSHSRLSQVIHGAAAYSDLPALYTGGFVDFELVERARSIDGRFYHSMIPDVYSSIVFAKLTERFAYSEEPLAIGGSSSHSGGTAYMTKQKTTRLSETPAGKFLSEPNIPFHENLISRDIKMSPPSIELIVYESLLQTEHIEPSCIEQTGHAEQLAIILSRAKRKHLGEITEWAKQFSSRHGLDYSAISKKARRTRLRKKVVKASRTLGEKRSTISIQGSRRLPINDVYDASIVIGTALELRSRRSW